MTPWLPLSKLIHLTIRILRRVVVDAGAFPQLPVFFNLAGVVTGFISTFLAYGKTR